MESCSSGPHIYSLLASLLNATTSDIHKGGLTQYSGMCCPVPRPALSAVLHPVRQAGRHTTRSGRMLECDKDNQLATRPFNNARVCNVN
eukprot:gene14588-biopygen20112